MRFISRRLFSSASSFQKANDLSATEVFRQQRLARIAAEKALATGAPVPLPVAATPTPFASALQPIEKKTAMTGDKAKVPSLYQMQQQVSSAELFRQQRAEVIAGKARNEDFHFQASGSKSGSGSGSGSGGKTAAREGSGSSSSSSSSSSSRTGGGDGASASAGDAFVEQGNPMPVSTLALVAALVVFGEMAALYAFDVRTKRNAGNMDPVGVPEVLAMYKAAWAGRLG